MEFEVTFEEIYSEEIALAKQIVETVKRNKNKLVYDKFVFGAKYKAYLNNDNKYVMCSCDRKSIENRIKLFNKQYFVSMNNQWKYFDYVYNRHIDNPTLEYFLGLPKELNIDYSKDVISQITFEDEICHRCCGVDYQYLIQPEDRKKQVDKRREIEKENYFIANGFHYVPLYKKSYLIIDELNDEDKKELLFEFNEFPIKDKVCVGYQKFIDNPNKEKQIEDIKAIMEMPIDIQLYILYVDKRALKSAMQSFRNEDFEIFEKIEQVCNKKVRELQSKYLINFPVSTSPRYLFTQLYRMLIDCGFEYYNSNIKDDEEIDDDLTKLKNLMVKYLNEYIDYGGDVELYYEGESWLGSNVFADIVELVDDEKLNDRFAELVDDYEEDFTDEDFDELDKKCKIIVDKRNN